MGVVLKIEAQGLQFTFQDNLFSPGMQQVKDGMVFPEDPVDLLFCRSGWSGEAVMPGIPAMITAELLIGAAMQSITAFKAITLLIHGMTMLFRV